MKRLLTLLCEVLTAIALFAIMSLTFFDVLGRKLLNNSIPGSLELTELLMVVVIFAGLPLVSERGEHVEFDSLDAYLPEWVRRFQSAAVHIVCGCILVGLGWLMWGAGGQFLASRETTAQLGILKAPFLYGMAVMCAITGMIHLILVAQPPVERSEGQGVAL